MKPLEYTVHSVTTEKVPVETEYRGKPISALVDGLTVELVNDGHGHTFRFVPEGDEDLQAHQAIFQVGKKVHVTFEAVQQTEQAELPQPQQDHQ